MKKINLLALVLIAMMVFTSISTVAFADNTDWPKKNVNIIIPFNPGGDTDFNARCYAEALPAILGCSVNCVNVNGNGGAVGALQAYQSANDGYTVLFTSSALLTAELAGTIDFSVDDMTFSCLAGQGPGNAIVMSKEFCDANNITDLASLQAYTQANPGMLNCAADTGATTQVCALLLKNAGFDVNVVDTGNSSERITALLGMNVDIIINSYGSIKDYLKNGDFVCLGLCTDKHPTYIEGVQTCLEQGFDISFPSYYFFVFPGGTDEAIAAKLADACKQVTETESYAERVKTAYSQEVVFAAGTEGKAIVDIARENIKSLRESFGN